jgi:hypothetical protein
MIQKDFHLLLLLRLNIASNILQCFYHCHNHFTLLYNLLPIFYKVFTIAIIILPCFIICCQHFTRFETPLTVLYNVYDTAPRHLHRHYFN